MLFVEKKQAFLVFLFEGGGKTTAVEFQHGSDDVCHSTVFY